MPFFTRKQALRIVELAQEPYKTIYTLAWSTGMRAGEILALTVSDLDFERRTIRVNKSADDRTRIIRQPKTRKSVASLPMSAHLNWSYRTTSRSTGNKTRLGCCFQPARGTRPRARKSILKNSLEPILRKLGIPEKHCGLHAFRHGLATELAESCVPITVLQQQVRHADVKTTLRVLPMRFLNPNASRWSVFHFQSKLSSYL